MGGRGYIHDGALGDMAFFLNSLCHNRTLCSAESGMLCGTNGHSVIKLGCTAACVIMVCRFFSRCTLLSTSLAQPVHMQHTNTQTTPPEYNTHTYVLPTWQTWNGGSHFVQYIRVCKRSVEHFLLCQIHQSRDMENQELRQ